MAYNKKKIKAEYGAFLRQYTRKKQRNGPDPNDRVYDRELEEKLKRMKPAELAELLSDDDEEEQSVEDQSKNNF